jgi:hypothetical protein
MKPHPTATHQSAGPPSGKIPCLLVDDSTLIFPSQNICAYLQYLAKVAPAEGLKRFDALSTESIADSIMDAALLLRYERLDRPVQWPEWTTGQLSKIARSIPVLSSRISPIPAKGPLGLDQVAIAVSCWYMDKRAPDTEWRTLEGGDKLDDVRRFIQSHFSPCCFGREDSQTSEDETAPRDDYGLTLKPPNSSIVKFNSDSHGKTKLLARNLMSCLIIIAKY